MHTNIPKAVINHHNQELSADAKSVEFLTIKVHFARDRPKPLNAPYLKGMKYCFKKVMMATFRSENYDYKNTLTEKIITLQQWYDKSTSREENQSN